MDSETRKFLYAKVEELINLGLRLIEIENELMKDITGKPTVRGSYVPGLDEVIRLLSSEKFDFLGDPQILQIGEYYAVQIKGEIFFGRPFTKSKPAATILRLAKRHDRKEVLTELKKIKSSLGSL